MSEEQKEKWRRFGRNLIGKGLPVLGGAVAGPAGATIGALIGSAMGVDGTDPDEMEAALAEANPDALIKLKELETSVAIAKLETSQNEQDNLTKRLESDNTAESTLTRNIRPVSLAVTLGAYLVFIYISTFALDDPESEQTAIEFGQQIKFLLATIVGFYFGSRGTEKIVKTVKGEEE